MLNTWKICKLIHWLLVQRLAVGFLLPRRRNYNRWELSSAASWNIPKNYSHSFKKKFCFLNIFWSFLMNRRGRTLGIIPWHSSNSAKNHQGPEGIQCNGPFVHATLSTRHGQPKYECTPGCTAKCRKERGTAKHEHMQAQTQRCWHYAQSSWQTAGCFCSVWCRHSLMWGAEEIGSLCAPLSLPCTRTRLGNTALHQLPDSCPRGRGNSRRKGTLFREK